MPVANPLAIVVRLDSIASIVSCLRVLSFSDIADPRTAATMSWNGRSRATLSLPRFYPAPAASVASKQVQPNALSLHPHPQLAASSRPPRHAAPQPYISSPTNCTSPSHSHSPYAAHNGIPPIGASPQSQPQPQLHAHTQPLPLPPNTILVHQANGPSILVTLPPQPPRSTSRPPSQHSYFRSQQLSQAVAPLSQAAVSILRSSSASSPVYRSSEQSMSYYANESSVQVSRVHVSHVSATSSHCEQSVVSQPHASVTISSRRVSLNAPLQPMDFAPSAPSPTPPLANPSAAAVRAVQPSSGVAPISYPTDFTSSSWSMFLVSLPASPVFLHYLSVSLVSVHSVLLLVSVLFFLLTLLPSVKPLDEPLCFYLLFYAVKSIAALSMCAYRLSHPECWQVDDLSDDRRSARFQVCRHVLRCVTVASTGVVTWWLFSGDDSWANGAAVSRYVLALLCVEYLSILIPLLSNLLLSFFVPCIHLSFYLPYLPFPALQSPVIEEEHEKAGMSEEDLTNLPFTRYHPSAIPRDTTCAVCLCEIEAGDEVRQLTCKHMYHRPCIDSWLRKRGVCPLCVRKVSVKSTKKPEEAAEVTARGGAGVELGAISVSNDSSTCIPSSWTLENVSWAKRCISPDRMSAHNRVHIDCCSQ